MNSLLLKNGHLIDPANHLDQVTDLLIQNGKIAAVGPQDTSTLAKAGTLREVDATGCYVLPGIADLCVSLREPGYKQKGTFASELSAAVKGGVTSLCSHPLSKPVNDTEAIVRLIKNKCAEQEKSRVFPVAAATKGAEGLQLSEYQGLKSAGCVAVCHNRKSPVSSQVLRRSFQYATTHDLLVVIEPEDLLLAADGCIADGRMSTRLGLVGLPEVSETIALSKALLLAEETGVRLHVAQISSAKSADLIRQAKARGVKVTCDVSIHNLLLTDGDIEDFNSYFHLLPPLRTDKDRVALQEAVASGVIDAIVSQHLPHEIAAKQAPFAESEAGASSLELLLPLALKLVAENRVSRDAVIKALTTLPASIMGIDNYGFVAGNDADLCIIDPVESFAVTVSLFTSIGKNSPFIGEKLNGVVRYTFVGGVQVYPAK